MVDENESSKDDDDDDDDAEEVVAKGLTRCVDGMNGGCLCFVFVASER